MASTHSRFSRNPTHKLSTHLEVSGLSFLTVYKSGMIGHTKLLDLNCIT